jgi:ribosomal-protein-alanine N-acetyltransferase
MVRVYKIIIQKASFTIRRNSVITRAVIVSRPLAAQPATAQDAARLRLLLQSARRVHQHLDWHEAPAWLGRRPFYFAVDGQRVVGSLAAPPDPPDTAWVRLLAIANGVPVGDVLRALWPPSRRELEANGVRLIAALAVEDWVGPALAVLGFQNTNQVVVLARSRPRTKAPLPAAPGLPFHLRPLRPADLPAVVAVDQAAFAAPWHVSQEALGLALGEAGYATTAEAGDPPRLVGFQISTESRGAGHLARLAVLPEVQGQGIATALAGDAMAYFDSRRARRVTVNTQQDNQASLAVYERLGFQSTGEQYGVWQMTL